MEVKSRFKKTAVGIIPEDWDATTLDAVAFVTSGKRLPLGSSLTENETPHPYIRVADMKPGSVSLDNIKFVPSEVFPSIKRFRIYKEDLFISVAGSLGIVGKIPNELEGANLTENADRITQISCSQDFLLHLLLSPLIQNTINALQTIGAQPKLALTRIRKFDIPLPPTKVEQQAIAEALSDADALIEALEQLIAKKRLVMQGMMQELLTGRRRLPVFSREWGKGILGELCYLITKQTGFDYSATIKPSLSRRKVEGFIPFVQNKDFEGNRINFDTDFYIPESIANKFPEILLDEPCLLISISGRIGNVGFFNGSTKAFIGGAVGIARFHQPMLAKWAMLYFLSNDGQEQIFQNEKAGAQHNITIEDVRKLVIPLPEEKEQIAISTIMSDMDMEIESLSSKLKKAKQIKQGMMLELLTGRIRLV